MGDRLKVLCVDDNRDAARSIGQVLELAGCEVRVCHDGASALAAAREFRPDVCVLDLKMPGMSGEELALRLQEQAGEHPPRCVALTGLWDIDAQHRTNNAGFDEHLVKPADPERLVEAVLGCKLADAAAGRG
jgi:two-component system, OmpR family, response regulator